jgi:hypothetical protein
MSIDKISWRITMNKPVLVIMAAGMGSRYGGLKQMDPIDPEGHFIMDYSIYDAREAGFEKVIFIIKKELEKDFKERIVSRVSRFMDTECVFQRIDDLPEGFAVPEGRVKPWGTGHALYACREVVDGPFVAINADDYYGKQAFRDLYRHLSSTDGSVPARFAMSGYHLENTVTENGHVARGICSVSPEGFLTDIVERTRIEVRPDGIAYSEDDGATWNLFPENVMVSMNMWGFTRAFLDEAVRTFPLFLEKALVSNPLKGEFFIPSIVDSMLVEGKATVQVLPTPDKWFGVTYAADKENVVAAIARMKADGLYPGQF